MLRSLYFFSCIMIVSSCNFYSLAATSLQIINDTHHNFLISDHQSQAIMIPMQESYDIQITPTIILYCYIQFQLHQSFILTCGLSEKHADNKIITLLVSDIIANNISLLYPNIFIVKSKIDLEAQTSYIAQRPETVQGLQSENSYTNNKPTTYPTTEIETQNLLQLIKQQQLLARESFQNNSVAKPTRVIQENVAQKATSLIASRQHNTHQFARSSRRN